MEYLNTANEYSSRILSSLTGCDFLDKPSNELLNSFMILFFLHEILRVIEYSTTHTTYVLGITMYMIEHIQLLIINKINM